MTIEPPIAGSDCRLLHRNVAECSLALSALVNMGAEMRGKIAGAGHLEMRSGDSILRIKTSANEGTFGAKQSAIIAVVSSKNPSQNGDSISFTASITPGNVFGTVQFTIDGSNFGSPSVITGGTAVSTSTTSLAVGTHTIGALYSGDNTTFATNGAMTQTVTTVALTVAVSGSPNPSTQGAAVSFTAALSNAGVAATSATGTVSFYIDGGFYSTATVSGGSASTPTTTSMGVGAHTVRADYSGDLTYSSASGSFSQTVNKSTLTVTVTSATNPCVTNQSVTYTAHISATAATGTVQFKVDGTNSSTPKPVSSGLANISIAIATAGTHTITADYSGDATYFSASGSFTETVQAFPSGFTITPASPSIYLQQNYNFTITANGGSTFSGPVKIGVWSSSSNFINQYAFGGALRYSGSPAVYINGTQIQNATSGAPFKNPATVNMVNGTVTFTVALYGGVTTNYAGSEFASGGTDITAINPSNNAEVASADHIFVL